MASDMHYHSCPQENVVIVLALFAALVVLVAVTFISSIDFSGTRRH
jgi:hypothetical protein